jgi:hypothetical protein
MNRGVEMVVDPAELPGSVILDQVTNGVAVRMAVLFQLLGSAPISEVRRHEQLAIRGGTCSTSPGERAPTWRSRTAGSSTSVRPSRRRHPRCHGLHRGPGFVDLHVHLREPGREEAETIETGSRAAALGGFTAIVAMPNTEPAQDSLAVIEFVRAQGRRAGCATCIPAGCITMNREGAAVGAVR